MDQILIQLTQYGALGVFAGASFIAYYRLSNRLLSVIESNTRAFERLAGIISELKQNLERK
jgi:hypothetical protein